MDIIITTIIILGTIVMVQNILWYISFLRNSRDIFSSGTKQEKISHITGLILLIFFFLGYTFIWIFSDPDIMVALILFFGSVFVTIMLYITFTLLDSVKKRSLDIAEVLIGVIDARDPNLNGHSVHVQNLTMLIFKYLPRHLKNKINPISLEYASLMHDIGKLGVPEAILNKPSKLTDEEWKKMREHPMIGVNILKPLRAFEEIDDWIFSHHERMDGNGYYKVEGKDIPLAARIISIADTYSAITMRRSYKDPRTHEDAISIIKDVAGTQLDKELVEIFISIPKEEVIACIPETIKY